MTLENIGYENIYISFRQKVVWLVLGVLTL